MGEVFKQVKQAYHWKANYEQKMQNELFLGFCFAVKGLMHYSSFSPDGYICMIHSSNIGVGLK